MQKSKAIERPWSGLGSSIKISLNSRRNCRGKKRERSGCPGVPILAFMSLVCQLASIVIKFVVVLLLTGIAEVALAARAKGDRIREGPPKFRERRGTISASTGESSENSRSR